VAGSSRAFIVTRIDWFGERIPLTIANFNVDCGAGTMVIQAGAKTCSK
jgi:hypothetical protein